jgi:sugar lactone lactonase YvrE
MPHDVSRAGDRASRALYAAAMMTLACSASAPARAVRVERPEGAVTVERPGLYPETIEYNRKSDRFMLGSFREGAVYEVDRGGNVSVLVKDERLCSVLGIAVDAERGRVWVTNSDMGVSVKRGAAGVKHLAAVGVYDLSTGAPLQYVDLAPLSSGLHLLNGITLDADGNAYVTDSFSPIIYKVDSSGAATLFLRDERFAGDGVNLNGLIVHPNGYLLVIKKSDGALFRVPLANPSRLTRVDVAQSLVGGDGLVLVDPENVALIANQTPGVASNAVISLSSDDDWMTAKVRAVRPLGHVYPTTGVLRKGTLYVVHSNLDELIRSPPSDQALLRRKATIQPIAPMAP